MACKECNESGDCSWCGGTGREGLAFRCRSCFGSGVCLSCGNVKLKRQIRIKKAPAEFGGEWVGKQTSVNEDGTTTVQPISLSLNTLQKQDRYIGNYRWAGTDPNQRFLLPSHRIDGSVSSDLMTFEVPSPFGVGHGQMVVSGSTIIGELSMPNEPKRSFKATRKED